MCLNSLFIRNASLLNCKNSAKFRLSEDNTSLLALLNVRKLVKSSEKQVSQIKGRHFLFVQTGIHKVLFGSDCLQHLLACNGCKVGGDSVFGYDAEVTCAAQCATFGPYKVMVKAFQSGRGAYLLDGELYGEAYGAVGDAHVGDVVAE